MAERQTRPHWKELPEFNDTYMPWGDKLIESEAVKNIVSKVEADKAALANSGARMLPNLNYLSTTVQADIDGETRDYLVGFSSGGKEDWEEDTITITYAEGDHSIMLFPTRQSGYKVGMSLRTKPGFHPLVGSGHSYSPYPFLDQPKLMEYAEQVVGQVSASLNQPSS